MSKKLLNLHVPLIAELKKGEKDQIKGYNYLTKTWDIQVKVIPVQVH